MADQKKRAAKVRALNHLGNTLVDHAWHELNFVDWTVKFQIKQTIFFDEMKTKRNIDLVQNW